MAMVILLQTLNGGKYYYTIMNKTDPTK